MRRYQSCNDLFTSYPIILVVPTVIFLALCLQTLARRQNSKDNQRHLANGQLGSHNNRQLISGGCSTMEMQRKKHRWPYLRQFLRLCYKSPFVAGAAYVGLEQAVKQCQAQMLYNRWNCTINQNTLRRFKSPEDQRFTILSNPPILQRANKESAFFIALSSAGVAWGVARACVRGLLSECKCSVDQNAKQQAWEWSGCSYSVKYGLIMSRRILAPRRNQRSMDPLVGFYKHNLRAGRLTIKKTTGESCKCHGVSGSCQLKTCWKAVADMSFIGSLLSQKYRTAIRVESQSNALSDIFNPLKSTDDAHQNLRLKHQPYGFNKIHGYAENMYSKTRRSRHHENIVERSSLIYLSKSPSFCDHTHGRVCDVRNHTHSLLPVDESHDSDNLGRCHKLCCGGNWTTEVQRYEENCDCFFTWCCKVTCNKCWRTKFIFTCGYKKSS